MKCGEAQSGKQRPRVRPYLSDKDCGSKSKETKSMKEVTKQFIQKKKGLRLLNPEKGAEKDGKILFQMRDRQGQGSEQGKE